MTTIAYIIASHGAPDQVIRLARTIRQGSSTSIILIHHDGEQDGVKHELKGILSDVFLIPNPTRIQWGDVSVLDIVLKGIQYLFDNKIGFDWLVLISGQDYPIKPIALIEKELSEAGYDGFIAYYSLETGDSLARQLIHDRYYFSYYKLPRHWRVSSLLEKLQKFNQRQNVVRFFPGIRNANPRIGFRRLKTIFNEEFVCYKGQFWWSLNYKCIQYINETISNNPEIFHFYQQTMIPDESMIQTVLANNKDLKLKNDHLRYIDWSSGNLAHPKQLGEEDFEKMISSGKHFARKFNIDKKQSVLDLIDNFIAHGRQG